MGFFAPGYPCVFFIHLNCIDISTFDKLQYMKDKSTFPDTSKTQILLFFSLFLPFYLIKLLI